MEEKKSFEALQYSYENAGQFRAIAAVLGYSEEYRNGDIIFSKGNETYTYPLNTLKLGNLGDNRESLLEQSKERIISFFDKEQASNNFQEYSQSKGKRVPSSSKLSPSALALQRRKMVCTW